MLSKINKIIIIFLIIFNHNTSYSMNPESLKFDEKIVYNYFSALVSLNNNSNSDSLKFFNYSKNLKETHDEYIKQYIFSLILNEKINKAINEIKSIENKKYTDFFEAQLLLVIDSLKRKDFKSSSYYLKKLKRYEEIGTFEFIITGALEKYIYLFNKNKINTNLKDNFGNFSLVNKAFQSCYLGKSNTGSLFLNIINSEDVGKSRYIFFYINYLLSQNNLKTALAVSNDIDDLNSTLLLSQTKKWLINENYKNFENIFSCKNSNNIISEFLFLISNIYSGEGDLKKSNFYFNLSNYLNPSFKFNLSLLVDNYLEMGDLNKSENILKNFDKNNEIYYWYKIKKKTQIIDKNQDSLKASKYIKNEFKKLKNPSLKIILDMANIVKGFGEYELSIEYYTTILSRINSDYNMYADILYRRGGSYERIGMEEKSDEDLLESLTINPNSPYVLNYLAYAWLERNYKIDIAIEMLEKAYALREEDPYITDSIGWAYYLIGEYQKAEKLLKKAVRLMPNDPVVNDHYGDVLWKLGNKIQASYFWNNVLSFDDTEDKMRKEILYKLIKGPKKI